MNLSRMRFPVPLLAAAGLFVGVLIYGPALRLTIYGVTDFISFYSRAKLVGTPDLYNSARMLEVQAAAAG